MRILQILQSILLQQPIQLFEAIRLKLLVLFVFQQHQVPQIPFDRATHLMLFVMPLQILLQRLQISDTVFPANTDVSPKSQNLLGSLSASIYQFGMETVDFIGNILEDYYFG